MFVRLAKDQVLSTEIPQEESQKVSSLCYDTETKYQVGTFLNSGAVSIIHCLSVRRHRLEFFS